MVSIAQKSNFRALTGSGETEHAITTWFRALDNYPVSKLSLILFFSHFLTFFGLQIKMDVLIGL